MNQDRSCFKRPELQTGPRTGGGEAPSGRCPSLRRSEHLCGVAWCVEIRQAGAADGWLSCWSLSTQARGLTLPTHIISRHDLQLRLCPGAPAALTMNDSPDGAERGCQGKRRYTAAVHGGAVRPSVPRRRRESEKRKTNLSWFLTIFFL